MSFGVVINVILLAVVAGIFVGSSVHIIIADHPDPLWAIVLMLSVIAAQMIRIANKT